MTRLDGDEHPEAHRPSTGFPADSPASTSTAASQVPATAKTAPQGGKEADTLTIRPGVLLVNEPPERYITVQVEYSDPTPLLFEVITVEEADGKGVQHVRPLRGGRRASKPCRRTRSSSQPYLDKPAP